MSATALLHALESLPHDARLQRMVELGRTAVQDQPSAALLEELEKGEFYQRLLALHACYGSRDGAHALRALSDPSRTLQARALKLVALFGSDRQVQEALFGARPKQRLVLLHLLRRRRRPNPTDAFLDELAGRDPATLAVLLPFGTAPVIARHLAPARHLGGMHFWHRLAHLHPAQAVAVLKTLLQEAAPPDARLIAEAVTVLDALAERQPDLGLELARALAAHVPLSRFPAALEEIGVRRPVEGADLLLASADTVAVRLDRAAQRLDFDRLRRLLETRPGTLAQPQRWFRRLPPGQRAAVFAVAGLLANRRALRGIVQLLAAAVGNDRRRLEPVARAVLAVLARDALTVGIRIALAAATLSWRELAELFSGLADSEFHADAVAAGTAALEAWLRRPDAADLEQLETALAGSRDERLRRLAVAALAAQSRLPGGWSTARLQRLRAYRADAAPLVAAAAQFILPTEEEGVEETRAVRRMV